MNEPRYCELCGCVCVACVQLEDGCNSCHLKFPERICDFENSFTAALLDHFEGVTSNE